MERISLTGGINPAAVQINRAEASARVPPQVPGDDQVKRIESAAPRTDVGYVAEVREEEPSTEEIQRRAVETVRQAINEAGVAIEDGSRLVIRHDDTTGRFVYEFRDPSTDEVVQQFPAEEVLKALASFRQALTGTALDREV